MRRVLDKRTPFIIADNGMKLESRIHTENAARAVLLVVDNPDIAAGKRYTVCDRDVYSIKQRVEFIAGYLRSWNLSSSTCPGIPAGRATRSTGTVRHSVVESQLIRQELGLHDPVPMDLGMRRTVDWIMANKPEPGGELEQQIGDPFAYDKEDELIKRWQGATATLSDIESPLPSEHRHFYRHPKVPGEKWTRP